ncbi:MAG: hypothetical protein ABMA02_13640 [Saprospiraceae bacterium]
MEDPQEYKSLDDLFRKTFEDLPDRPAPSGWDTPSPRVWEQVQTKIQPPKAGWTAPSLLLVAGMAVVLLLGLYWALSRPNQPAADTLPAVTESPTLAAEPTNQNQIAVPELTASAPATHSPATPAPNRRREFSSQPASPQMPDSETTPRRSAGSLPLPGTAQAPNTTIRRQMEELRHAPWAQPLRPLPNVLKKAPMPPLRVESVLPK